jgi:hypothetical protein
VCRLDLQAGEAMKSGGDSGIIEVIDVGAAASHVQGIVAHAGTLGGVNRMTI